MAEVKPAEVSAILKQQLSGFEAGASGLPVWRDRLPGNIASETLFWLL